MKIFTWEEIVNGQVPKKESFAPFLEEMQNILKDTIGIVSGSHFGSTHRGDYGITSDIDIYVIYKEKFAFEVSISIKDLTRKAKELFIPFNVVAIPDEGIVNTDHTPISPRLQQVLAYTAQKDDGCFIGDIRKFLFHYNLMEKEDFSRVVRNDIERYVGYKLRNYFEGRFSNELLSPQKRLQWMESATNGFVHTTRGVLASYGGVEFIDGTINEVWNILHKYQAKSKAPDLFSEHLGAREGYRKALKVALFGPAPGITMDKEAYMEMGCKEEKMENFVYVPAPEMTSSEKEESYKLSLDVFADHLGVFPEYVEILIQMLK